MLHNFSASLNENTLPCNQPRHQFQETFMRPCEAIPRSFERSGEELRTASRLLDPNEPWNRSLEHQKAIALVRAADRLPVLTPDEPKHEIRHPAGSSPDRPKHARFGYGPNANRRGGPTAVRAGACAGTQSRSGADADRPNDHVRSGAVPNLEIFPSAAALAKLSFAERLEVLRLSHDRHRRLAADSESERPPHLRSLGDMHTVGGNIAKYNARYLGQCDEAKRRPTVQPMNGPCDLGAKNMFKVGQAKESTRVGGTRFTESPGVLPPAGLVGKYTRQFEERLIMSACSSSSSSSSNNSLKFSTISESSSCSSSSAPGSPIPLPAALPPPEDQILEARTRFYHDQAVGPNVDSDGNNSSLLPDLRRPRLHRMHACKYSVKMGVGPEMAATAAVSFNGLVWPWPKQIPEKVEAIEEREAELAKEEQRQVDLNWKLERERVLKEDRVVVRAQREGQGKRGDHEREPAFSGGYIVASKTKRRYCHDGLPQTGSPSVYSTSHRPYAESMYPTRTPVSPLKRSGAFSAPRRSDRTDMMSSRVSE